MMDPLHDLAGAKRFFADAGKKRLQARKIQAQKVGGSGGGHGARSQRVRGQRAISGKK